MTDKLPRCEHGNCLEDGGGAFLEPPCGCRAALAATPAPADDERVLTSEITRLRKENSELASRLLAATPAETLERIAELQYEAGMYECLYENSQKRLAFLIGDADLTHYEADAESVLAVSASAVGGDPVAWRYKCQDGSEELMFKRLTDEQKRRGYYTGEDGEDEVEGDEAIVGPFHWAEETPLYAGQPASPFRELAANDLADLMKLARDDRVSAEALGIRLRALWTSNR